MWFKDAWECVKYGKRFHYPGYHCAYRNHHQPYFKRYLYSHEQYGKPKRQRLRYATSGVSKVTWSSDKGGSGNASGTTYWSISSISLSSGENKITVTAKDLGGNTSTDTITVTYSAATEPTVTTGSTSNVTATSATLYWNGQCEWTFNHRLV